MNEQRTLRPKIMNSFRLPLLLSVLAASSFLCAGLTAAPQTKTDAATDSDSKQKQFNTPKEAAENLVQAAESFDVATLTEILGPDSADVISSQDPVADKKQAMAFAAKAKEKSDIGTDPKNPNHAILTIGDDDFPLPIPIVKQKGKWIFEMKADGLEILNRRIGTNELDAITICRGFVAAQEEYAQEKHDDAKVTQYAQRIFSSPEQTRSCRTLRLSSGRRSTAKDQGSSGVRGRSPSSRGRADLQGAAGRPVGGPLGDVSAGVRPPAHRRGGETEAARGVQRELLGLRATKVEGRLASRARDQPRQGSDRPAGA